MRMLSPLACVVVVGVLSRTQIVASRRITENGRDVGDLPLSEDQNIELMEKIVNDQRMLLKDVFNMSDVSSVPQVWTLCELFSLALTFAFHPLRASTQ